MSEPRRPTHQAPSPSQALPREGSEECRSPTSSAQRSPFRIGRTRSRSRFVAGVDPSSGRAILRARASSFPRRPLPTRSYSALDALAIHATIVRLRQRIEERFPGAGLSGVAAELERLSEETQRVTAHLRRPVAWLRAFVLLASLALVLLVLWLVPEVVGRITQDSGSLWEIIQGFEAALNELVFLGLTIFFLLSLETRKKRREALVMLHKLRSLAHVVDMHQLTKDPEHVLRRVEPTQSSPTRTLTREQLVRYLNYCSELLSLNNKLAALHAQSLQDPVVLDSVNDVEVLGAELSRKIWQKITILDMAAPGAS